MLVVSLSNITCTLSLLMTFEQIETPLLEVLLYCVTPVDFTKLQFSSTLLSQLHTCNMHGVCHHGFGQPYTQAHDDNDVLVLKIHVTDTLIMVRIIILYIMHTISCSSQPWQLLVLLWCLFFLLLLPPPRPLSLWRIARFIYHRHCYLRALLIKNFKEL